MSIVTSTEGPVSNTRLILQTKRIVLVFLGAHLFRVDPALLALGENLAAAFTCAVSSVVKE